MVAVRTRANAVVLAGLLLASSLVAIVPTASAAALSLTNVDVLIKQGTNYIAIAPTDTINGGDELRITYTVSVGQCEAQGTPIGTGTHTNQPPNNLWINTTDTAGRVSSTMVKAPVRSPTAAETSITGTIDFTVGNNLNPGIDGATGNKITVTAEASCPTPPALCQVNDPCTFVTPTPSSVQTSTSFKADTRAPQLTLGSIALTHSPSRANTGSSSAAIGTEVELPISVLDGSAISLFKVDESDLPGGQATEWDATPAGDTVEVTIADSTSSFGVNGDTLSIFVRAEDAFGNTASGSRTVVVDNVRPPTTTTYVGSPATMTRTAGAGAIALALSTTYSGATADVSHALVTITSSVGGGASTTQTALVPKAGGSVSIPAPGDEVFTRGVSIALDPVDSAGNLQTAAATHKTVAFTEGASVFFGGLQTAPGAVKANGIGAIFVNATANKPSISPMPARENMPIGARIVRLLDTGDVFWNASNSSGSADKDFFPATASARDLANTTFYPGTTATAPYMFTNASGKTFKENEYELRIFMRSPQGNTLNLIYPFDIDSTKPRVNNHGIYLNPSLGARNVSTDATKEIHGLDGNPLRVVLDANDTRYVGGGYSDSKLRNITIEFYDQNTFKVPLRAESGLPARIDITPTGASTLRTTLLPYLHIFPSDTLALNAADSFCEGPSGSLDAGCKAAWADIRTNTKRAVPQTWINATAFSGWVNTTMPDLPPGKYGIRVLTWDNADNVEVKTFGDYKVAPALKILSKADSPLLDAQDRLLVTVLASEFNATPIDRVRNLCTDMDDNGVGADALCPVPAVRVYVSNSNLASDPGRLYQTITLPVATPCGTSASILCAEPAFGVYSGFANSATGDLQLTDGTARYFRYEASPRSIATETGGSVDPRKDVYVRAEVSTLNDAGVEVLKTSTGWIKATSANNPTLKVNYPPADGAYNYTSAAGSKPFFNVSFDRKTEGTAPTMSYKVYKYTAGAADVEQDSRTGITPALSGSATPRVLFNWTGTLAKANGDPLAPGDYYVNFSVIDGTVPLASQVRYFSVLSAPIDIAINTSITSTDRVQVGATTVVADLFDLDIKIDHNFANLTSSDQVSVLLHRQNPRSNEKPTLVKGDEGFDFEQIMTSVEGDPNRTRADIHLDIDMPSSAVDGDLFQLEVRELVDPAPNAVHRALFIPVKIDRTAGSGRTFARETALSVIDPTTQATNSTPWPAFRGEAEDTGSGIKKIEVMVRIVTDDPKKKEDNKTLIFSKNGLSRDVIESESWASSDMQSIGDSANPLFTRMVEIQQLGGGKVAWRLPFNNRTCYADAAGATVKGCGGFMPNISTQLNISNEFEVTVRVTDNLSQASRNVTRVTLNPSAPILGVSGQLGVPTSLRSGIESTATLVDYHADPRTAILKVKVTDNNCLAAVRLKGYHEADPNTTFTAEMRPVSGTVDGRCPRGATGQWQIDLEDAPALTERVGNWTYWWEAQDDGGLITEVPVSARRFVMEVFDNAPAELVGTPILEPNPGQAGGRTIVRANVYDNAAIARVAIEFRDHRTGALVAQGNMTPEVEGATNGNYTIDTQDGLGITLEAKNYTVRITPFDVNWNRTAANGGPTCEDLSCETTTLTYVVRDDGPPTTTLVSPANGGFVNATPTFKLRAQHKLLDQGGIALVFGVDGVESTVASADIAFTELTGLNGTRQGWDLAWSPDALADGANLTLNVTLNVGGLTNTTSYAWRVDALPPTVSAAVTGTTDLNNKTWAVSTTLVTLTAEDNVSAATRLYTVNGGAQQTYSAPFTPAGEDGLWTLEYWATDGAGNAAAKKSLTLNLDRNGPRIAVAKHGDEILLTVTDAGVGLNESSVTVHYRYGEQVTYATKTAEKLSANSFTALLPGNATESGLAYYFTAQDQLGNLGTNFTALQPHVIAKGGGGGSVSNLEPTISITFPTPGSSAERTFDLKWLAEDPEGAPVSITIALSSPTSKVLSAAGENSGLYRLNFSGTDYPAGAYTIVVTATDGEKSATDSVTFNIEAGETIKPISVPPPTVQANSQVSIGVSIQPAGKTVLQASYRVIKDGQLYTSGKLTSTAGAYGAAFTPTESGAYRVLVDVAYSDGSTDASKQVAAFSVAGGPESGSAKVLPGSLIALVAIGALTVALAAYGAFGRWKK